MSQVTNYQCPACTGPLNFSPETGKVACEFCGSSYELAEIEALYAQRMIRQPRPLRRMKRRPAGAGARMPKG